MATKKKAPKYKCPYCGLGFGSPQAVGTHKRYCPQAKRYILIIDDDHEIGTEDEITEAIKLAREVDQVEFKDMEVYVLGEKMHIDITETITAKLMRKKGG